MAEENSEGGTIGRQCGQQLGDECLGPQWEISVGHHSVPTARPLFLGGPLALESKSAFLVTVLPGLCKNGEWVEVQLLRHLNWTRGCRDTHRPLLYCPF